MSEFHDGSRPISLPTNPGGGTTVQVAFANDERSWTEEADLVEILADVLEDQGHLVASHDGWLEHPESGYVILPQIVEGVHPMDNGGVRTTTTIQVHHPLLIPEGLFEYQHSGGSDTSDSIRKGFDQWAKVDFVTLLDAASVEPVACMSLKMTLPEQDGRPARTRRAILGPIANYQGNPPPPKPEGTEGEDGETHSYCPCCLLTRSMEAFKGLFEAEGFLGLRLFALRDNEGTPLADCRVNGDDYETGRIALRQYATTWPEAGYEFRKQYVILQTIDPAPGSGS